MIQSASRWQLPNWRWPWFGGELEIGLRRALHVREERLSTRHDAYRLLYVSDIHLRNGRSDVLCGQVLDSVTWCDPDVVLLGGDLVDGRSELIKLSELVRKIHDVARVLAIGGNHDRRIGINRVRAAVVHGGGQWIDGDSARLTHRGRLLVISGPEAAAPSTGMSASCALTTRESGRHPATSATTSSWQGTYMAANWSPASIEPGCFRERSFIRTAS